MPEWLEIMLAIIGGGGLVAAAPMIRDFFTSQTTARISDNASFRKELLQQVGELNGRVDTLRGTIEEWQQKYFDIASQNEILKHQNAELKEMNAELKKMVAALEDENEALQQKLSEVT